MKDPTSSPSPVRGDVSTESSVWSVSSVARSATVATANISSSVELIPNNSKKVHIASSTRELTTSSAAHLAILATQQRDARHRQQYLPRRGSDGYYQQGRTLSPYDNDDGYYDKEEDDFYHGDCKSDYYRR
ncbi:hypothetical protein D6D01_08370 [Aureobasidium pullulans]|uniref:Uncharacterized protein n=1 Tax=Aureobasidium pullulans TaxID=5580 RepID=A0A4S9KBW8_AURPU|nr:hypothetical protein D6D01_08370 [Aureobasidium pullulans]